jgi:hypothetical protein
VSGQIQIGIGFALGFIDKNAHAGSKAFVSLSTTLPIQESALIFDTLDRISIPDFPHVKTPFSDHLFGISKRCLSGANTNIP